MENDSSQRLEWWLCPGVCADWTL